MEKLPPLLSFETVIKHPADWVEHVCFDHKDKFMAISSCEYLYLWKVSKSDSNLVQEEASTTATANTEFGSMNSLHKTEERFKGEFRLLMRFCHPESVWKSQFNNSATFLYAVCGDGNLYVWEIGEFFDTNDSGRLCEEIKTPFQVFIICSKTGPFGMGVSLTSDVLFTCDQDGVLKAHASSDGSLLSTIKAHSDVSDDVAVSPNGHQVATCSKDRTICLCRLWVLETRMSDSHTINNPTGIGNSDYNSVSDIDTTAVTVSRPEDCYMLQIEHRLTGHNHWVFSVVYSPDSVLLASVSADRLIGIWSTQTGELIYHLSGHTNLVWSAVFVPGTANTSSIGIGTDIEQASEEKNKESIVNPEFLLVSCSSDFNVRAWDLQKAQVIETHGPLGREHCKLFNATEYIDEQGNLILTTTECDAESAIDAIKMPADAKLIMDTPNPGDPTKVMSPSEGLTEVPVPPSAQDQLFCCAYSQSQRLLAVTSYSGNVFIAHVRN